MTPAQLFSRCGQFLCGPGPKWKEQFAAMLTIQTNTVDNMSKGTSRVPPGIWIEIAGYIQDREQHAGALKVAVLIAAEPAFDGQPDAQRAMMRQGDDFQRSITSQPRGSGLSGPSPFDPPGQRRK